MSKTEQVFKNINQDLVDACRVGDRKAQFQLYNQYYLGMYNTSLRIVKDSAEAEDIMQEAFLAAFEKIHTYQGNVSFGAWLKRIVVNRSLDALRKRHMELVELGSNENVPLEDGKDEKEAVYEVEKVKKAIELLPDGYRIVISLHLFEGYDHKEIGEILGIAESSSRSQYARAKAKLKEIMS